jgi:hypothetical protein
MFRSVLLVISLLTLVNSHSWGAESVPAFTQKDFALMILEQFGWSDGVPKEPADRDYLLILGGKRSFRYEAENSYNALTDRVTVRSFPMFGEFTGKGWLLGVSDETSATFTILLPLSGEYDISAVIKGSGFVWNINGKEYRADAKSEKFQETEIARVPLKAGTITIKTAIPPEGAIDSFSLKSSDHAPIQPLLGWRFREALTAGRMAEVAVAMTNRYSQLPDVERSLSPAPLAVIEKAELPPSAAASTVSFLGPFAATKWVRADYRGATLQIPVVVAETGYYGLTINAVGETISGRVNDTPFKLSGKPYLEKLYAGLFRLESGDNTLLLTLPPLGGIDTIELHKKSTTPDDFLRLAGIPGPPERLIGSKEAAAFLKAVQGAFAVRK